MTPRGSKGPVLFIQGQMSNVKMSREEVKAEQAERFNHAEKHLGKIALNCFLMVNSFDQSHLGSVHSED